MTLHGIKDSNEFQVFNVGGMRNSLHNNIHNSFKNHFFEISIGAWSSTANLLLMIILSYF